MSRYFDEIKGSTISVDRKDFPNILSAVKKEVSLPKWNRYCWKSQLLAMDTLEDVLRMFSIGLKSENATRFCPVIEDVYVSDFLGELLKSAVPYMSDGNITITDGVKVFSIDVKEHVVTKTTLLKE